MVTDQQVGLLMKLSRDNSLVVSAAKAGMGSRTARKYLKSGKLPSECRVEHVWRTRQDPFSGIWEADVLPFLENNGGLEAKFIFSWLQRKYPGRFSAGQLRTLQRKFKHWRACYGPSKEVFFEQVHRPGELCQSDFTNMNSLGIRVGGVHFEHLLYHFVLTYSNWETGGICFSESFESLSGGFQGALWKLGGVPRQHRTDCLSAAVQHLDHPEDFTRRYEGLLNHYGIEGLKIRAGKANENGDVEKSHDLLKKAVDQTLMLRGSRDFENREEYTQFLKEIFRQRNQSRLEKLREEMAVLKGLPKERVPDYKRVKVRVTRFSLIRVGNHSYSVHSRLIGEQVWVHLHADRLEVFYGQKKIEEMQRLRGKDQVRMDYRHIIDWLARKPGAFENYRYKQAMFPSTWFRIAYDQLRSRKTLNCANREYLEILWLAGHESEQGVQNALKTFLQEERLIDVEAVKEFLQEMDPKAMQPISTVSPVDLKAYDALLCSQGGGTC